MGRFLYRKLRRWASEPLMNTEPLLEAMSDDEETLASIIKVFKQILPALSTRKTPRIALELQQMNELFKRLRLFVV